MLPTILAAFLFMLLLSVITVYGYRAYVRPSRIYDRVGGDGPGETARERSVNPRQRLANVFGQIGEKIPLSPNDQTVTRRDLTMAGFRSNTSIAVFYGVKVIGAVVMFMLGLILSNAIAPT